MKKKIYPSKNENIENLGKFSPYGPIWAEVPTRLYMSSDAFFDVLLDAVEFAPISWAVLEILRLYRIIHPVTYTKEIQWSMLISLIRCESMSTLECWRNHSNRLSRSRDIQVQSEKKIAPTPPHLEPPVSDVWGGFSWITRKRLGRFCSDFFTL